MCGLVPSHPRFGDNAFRVQYIHPFAPRVHPIFAWLSRGGGGMIRGCWTQINGSKNPWREIGGTYGTSHFEIQRGKESVTEKKRKRKKKNRVCSRRSSTPSPCHPNHFRPAPTHSLSTDWRLIAAGVLHQSGWRSDLRVFAAKYYWTLRAWCWTARATSTRRTWPASAACPKASYFERSSLVVPLVLCVLFACYVKRAPPLAPFSRTSYLTTSNTSRLLWASGVKSADRSVLFYFC